MKKILLLGPQERNGKKGGAVSLFYNLCQEFSKSKINFTIYNTNVGLIKKIILAASLFKSRNIYDIVVLNSSSDYLYLTPLIRVIFCNKNLVLRKFGGELSDVDNFGLIRKVYTINILRLYDGVTFETKASFKHKCYKDINRFWYPNVRPIENKEVKSSYNKRFVFLGQVKVEKGVLTLIEAFKELGDDYQLEIFGNDEIGIQTYIDKCNNIEYLGCVSLDEVGPILEKADFCILPTFYPGEGYPGVIIEAYMQNTPVISTHWKSIPEIVLDTVTGYLIPIQDSYSLRVTIENVDERKLIELSENCSDYKRNFDSHAVFLSFLRFIGI